MRRLVFTTFCAIFLSKVLWYDLRIVYADLGFVYLLFYGYSAAMFPFLLLYALHLSPTIVRQFWPFATVLLAAYGLAYGILSGNPFNYVAADTFKFLFLPVGFALGQYAFRHFGPKFVVTTCARLIAIFLAAKFLFFAVSNGSFQGLTFGGVTDIFAAVFVMVILVSGRYKKGWPIYAAFLLLALVIVAGQKRTALFLLLICFFVAALLYRGRKSLLPALTGFAIPVALIFVAAGTLTSDSALEGKLNRVTNTTLQRDIGHESKRFREVVLVVNEMSKANTLQLIGGYGSGATFEEIVPDARTGETETHSVHFTPAAFLLRYGLVGIIYIVGLYWYATIVAWRVLRSPPNEDTEYLATAALYLVSAIIGSLVIYGVVDDMLFALLLGVLKDALAHRGMSNQPLQSSGAVNFSAN